MTSDAPATPPPEPPRDPYPRMIIACIVISATLFLILSMVLLFDFTLRARPDQQVIPSSPEFFALPEQE